MKKINRALISVYHKDGLEEIVNKLIELGVEIISTGGTYDFIQSLGHPVTAVESLTGYPSIFGGRVKTLHPKIFGGILFRRDDAGDQVESSSYEIPPIDLVIVDPPSFAKSAAARYLGEYETLVKPVPLIVESSAVFLATERSRAATILST